jgi:nicotinate-nucleotide pyrophosphorylase
MSEIVDMMADSIQLDHLTLDQLKDLEKILEKIK